MQNQGKPAYLAGKRSTRCKRVVILLAILLQLKFYLHKYESKFGTSAAHVYENAHVVILKENANTQNVEEICQQLQGANFNGSCVNHFTKGFTGFSGIIPEESLNQLIDMYKDIIDYVENDGHIKITGTTNLKWATSDSILDTSSAEVNDLRLQTVKKTHMKARRKLPEQLNPAWNLDRIDQYSYDLDNLYHYYALGTGVHVYVIDTGIRSTHDEFKLQSGNIQHRVQDGFSVFGDGNTSDCNGHGTHVSAIIGGLKYGVAKNVTLVPVRAMDCDGDSTVSYMLKALEWISENAIAPAVLSMSVAGDLSLAINEAVRRLTEIHMITVVVAAGNGYQEACEVSPASAPSVLTVGASDQFDRRWARSNWGPCVDIHAPGVDVLSATNADLSGGTTKTGTSMACPHVAGVVALYLEHHPGASPAEIREKLNKAAISDLRDDVEGYGTFLPSFHPQSLDVSSTPRRLLYALLPSQVALLPGVIRVDSLVKIKIKLQLLSQPRLRVDISVQMPTADWSQNTLATVEPASFSIIPKEWNQPHEVIFSPSNITNGDYYIKFSLMSLDTDFLSLTTLKVVDTRSLTGESFDRPRIIPTLPFLDIEDSSRFQNNFTIDHNQDLGAAPDVFYAFKPEHSIEVDISTCGSTFDTKLFLLEDSSKPKEYISNDDDPLCTSNTRNSRISTLLQGCKLYYIIVDGYSSGWISAEGQYRLSIKERLQSVDHINI